MKSSPPSGPSSGGSAPVRGWRAWSWVPVAALGVALSCAALYPGFLNGDSEWQLAQARSGEYSTFHPPFLAVVWSWIDPWVPGAAGLFLLHVGMFWGGLSLLVHRLVDGPWRACAVALVLGLWPPLFLAFGMIGKDAGTLSALVLATGALLDARRRRARAPFLVALGALTYAYGVRYNALVAVLPFGPVMGAVLHREILGRDTRRVEGPGRPLSSGAGLLLGVVLAVHALVASVGPETAWSFQGTLCHDVVAVSLASGKDHVPPFYDREGPPLTLEELGHPHVFDPYTWNTLGWDGGCTSHDHPEGTPRRPGFAHRQEEFDSLVAHWLVAVWRHPGEYLAHRWQVYRALLGLAEDENWPYWFPSPETIEDGPEWNRPARRSAVRLSFDWRRAPVFRAWPYILGLVVTAALATRRRPREPLLFWTVVTSGLAYELAYVFVAPEYSFRYSWWTMAAALLAVWFLVAGRSSADSSY